MSDYETVMQVFVFTFLILMSPLVFSSDWMDNLAQEIRDKGIKVEDKKDLMRFLKSSSQENNTQLWSENQEDQQEASKAEKLARDLVTLTESSDGRKVQINFFEKAYFYKNSRNDQQRFLSSTPKNSTSFKKKEKIDLKSRFFFSRIEATDSNNGGSLRTSSKLNMGLTGSYSKSINQKMDLSFRLGGSFIGFENPPGSSLQGESNVYFHGSGALDWRIDAYFSAQGFLGLKQLPYLTAFGTQVAVDQATHPSFGGSVDLHLLPATGIDIRPGFLIEVFNNSVDGDVTAGSGVLLGVKADYRMKYRDYNPMISLYYNTYSQETNNTTQSMNEVGLWFGIELGL